MDVREGTRELVAVVEQGGFTAAARHLGLSTSFVSRQVRRLEDRLQTRLLERTTRRVRLTELGRVYYEGCRDLLDRFDALEAELADLQRKPRGRVRVTAAGVYAERYVAPALAAFVERYPDVSVQLDTQTRLVNLVDEGYDLAVRMSPLHDASLVARKVTDRRVLVCASPGYLARRGRPSRPVDLREHDCLMLHGMPWRFAHADGPRAQPVRGPWSSDNGRALVAAAVAGLGLVRLTDYYVEDELARGELEVVLAEHEVRDAATWLLYPNRTHLPTRVRYLVDFLAEQLEPRRA